MLSIAMTRGTPPRRSSFGSVSHDVARSPSLKTEVAIKATSLPRAFIAEVLSVFRLSLMRTSILFGGPSAPVANREAKVNPRRYPRLCKRQAEAAKRQESTEARDEAFGSVSKLSEHSHGSPMARRSRLYPVAGTAIDRPPGAAGFSSAENYSTRDRTFPTVPGVMLAAEGAVTAPRPPGPASGTRWPAVGEMFAAMVDAAPNLQSLSEQDLAAILREPVFAAVNELKATGRPFVSVSNLVACLAAEAGIDQRRAGDMVRQLLAWCAQRFYAP